MTISPNRGARALAATSLALGLLVATPWTWAQGTGSAPRAESRATFLQALRVGQSITLKPGGMLVEIDILNEGTMGSYVVVEVAAQHIVLQDITGTTRSWIPTSAIKAINWTRLNTPTPAGKMPAPIGPWPAPAPAQPAKP
jgi:hypothetical protein